MQNAGIAAIPDEHDLGVAGGGREAGGPRRCRGVRRRHDGGGRVAVAAARGAGVHGTYLEGVGRAVAEAVDGVPGGVHLAVGAVGDVGPGPVVGAAVGGLTNLVLGDLYVVDDVRVAAGRVNGVPGERRRALAGGGREVGRGRGLGRGRGEWAFHQVECQRRRANLE